MDLIFFGAIQSINTKDMCINIDGSVLNKNVEKLIFSTAARNSISLIRFQGKAGEENKKQTSAKIIAKHIRFMIDASLSWRLNVNPETPKGAETRIAKKRLVPGPEWQLRVPMHDPIKPYTPSPTTKAVSIRVVRAAISM
ncbi:hypothetical protein GCM10007421_09490 [Halopseudomonas oceani]|nr:hypothetical protein GCM10007421_09490 [Halopseudomonas oceani]